VNGYAGKLLNVNLTTGEITTEALSENDARAFLGGRGLAAKLLLERLAPGTDPLGPDNVLIFATGPLEGTIVPGGTRFVACARSPLTGGWGEANAAGRFAGQLKRAGFDAVVITGRAASPVYLYIHQGQAELRDASHLWGQEVGETIEALQLVTRPNAAVACIGPAGERQVPFANIMHDYDRAAGRTGMGAVMGSKNLKAVVAWGTARVSVADPETLRRLVEASRPSFEKYPISRAFRALGTAAGVDGYNAMGMMPRHNSQFGYHDPDVVHRISGKAMTDTILVRNAYCPGCTVGCRRVVKVTAGESPYGPVDPRYGGPEFETVGAIGSLLGIYDLPGVAKANELCNRYGLDTIQVGFLIGWAMESYQRGVLTADDTGGLPLTWGNVEAVLTLIQQMARREGFGEELNRGFRYLIEKYGPETAAWALQVKNQAFAVHMPRGRIGQGLCYGVSNRGACHLQGIHDTTPEGGNLAPEIGIDERFKGLSRLSKEGKAELQVIAQNWRAVQDSAIVCKFTTWDFGPIMPGELLAMLNAVTGWDMTIEEMMRCGERAWTLGRLFNLREGFTRADDYLPARCAESLPEGPTAGSTITREDMDRLLDEYYALRRWDREGRPTPELLADLGLKG